MTDPAVLPDDADLLASDVAWDLETLLPDGATVDDLATRASAKADEIAAFRGRVGELTATEMAELLTAMEEISDLLSRAGHYVMLRFSENTADPERGAAMMQFEEASTAISTKLIFVDLEWAAADDDHVAAIIDDPALARARHHLIKLRANRPHLLTEPEELILTEKSVTGASAWMRLFEELTSAIEVDLDGETVTLEGALSNLAHPERDVRRTAAEAVSAALEPGLRTRSFVYNTLLLDKATDDRLRSFDTWLSSRNLANEASDASVQALHDAVVNRYDIAQRWYSLKASALGIDRLADYDRMASVATSDARIGWDEATSIVSDAYASFSPELAGIVGRFIDEGWIDAPQRPGKRPGAFCAYTVPSHHPYVLLNWTGRNRDVLTLAHELGHGLHAYLSREQGIFHHSTPLTLAETASVFGETVTNNRLLSMLDDPGERFSLLASTLDDAVATVFRQIAMSRFESGAHTARRQEGELSVDRLGDLWIETQTEMLGDSVELTDGYRSWWSYIPHFIGSPGYVYAYAYGQLLALSVYARYQESGDEFVPAYLELLRAGGSRSPEELGAIVDCDLADPGFWDAGLDIIERQLTVATDAASAAGRV
ncbi:MAG: M3 family oligoendopeptidase [Acidimicrobiales bacterium]